jgi:hypothetical protein
MATGFIRDARGIYGDCFLYNKDTVRSGLADLYSVFYLGQKTLRMNWSNIEKWRKLLKIGTIVLSSILNYCAKFKQI